LLNDKIKAQNVDDLGCEIQTCHIPKKMATFGKQIQWSMVRPVG
jgi:hypothetical protein